MAKNPIRAGTHKHPTGQRLNISLAFRDNKNRWQRAAAKINEVVDGFNANKVYAEESPSVPKDEKRTKLLTNSIKASRWIWNNKADDSLIGMSSKLVNAHNNMVISESELLYAQNGYRYEYDLSADQIDATMRTVENILTDDLLSGSEFWTRRFWMDVYIDPAMQDGVTDSFESAVNITEGTEAEPRLAILDARSRLATPVYLDRLKLVHGRVFENMKGLTAEMKSQLRLTLTEGVARGVGIRDLKGMINKRLSVGMSRAERIARTEINHAYRKAYLGESEDLNKDVMADTSYQIMQAHRSALSPTTRKHHAARHGTIHTMKEQQDWWATGTNSINCLCSTMDVLVNKKTGEVLQKSMIDNMLKQKTKWFPS